MKTLYFIRHAKSSWKHNVIDQQRPLRTRGVKDAEVVSKLVAASMPVPNLIITSDAVRAKTTAHYFKEAYALKETNFIMHYHQQTIRHSYWLFLSGKRSVI